MATDQGVGGSNPLSHVNCMKKAGQVVLLFFVQRTYGSNSNGFGLRSAPVGAKPKSGVKGTVKIPDAVTIDGIIYKVTAIEANAFKNNKNITKMIIGNDVTVVGKNAFAGCKKLRSVTVGKKVKTISASAFSGCTKLKTVKLGAAVTTIGDKAFYKCTSLTSIKIPAKVTKIGKSAFEGCKKLKSITVKSTKLKSVGKKALKGIHAKAKIKIPKSKLKKYKSLFKNKGQGKNVKVTK